MKFRQAGSFQIQGGAPDGQVKKFPVSTTGSSPNVRRNPSSALSAVTSERLTALYQGSMVTNAIYKWGNKQQVNLALASQKVNAEHREKLVSSAVGQTNYPSSLKSVILSSRTCLSYLRLCLLECRDP